MTTYSKNKGKTPPCSEWKDRANKFYAYAERHGENCEKERLIAHYAHHVGISPRTVTSYLKSFTPTGALREYGAHILTAERYYELTQEDFERLKKLSEG